MYKNHHLHGGHLSVNSDRRNRSLPSNPFTLGHQSYYGTLVMKAFVIFSMALAFAASAAVDGSKRNNRDLWDDLAEAEEESSENIPQNQKFHNFQRDRPSSSKKREPEQEFKHVPVPYPVEVEKRVPVEVKVPYRVEVEKKVPVIVEKKVPVIVEKKVPVHIDRPVPYPVEVKVPVVQKEYVEVPYPVEVEKKVPVFLEKPVYIERTVPVHIQIRRKKKGGKKWR